MRLQDKYNQKSRMTLELYKQSIIYLMRNAQHGFKLLIENTNPKNKQNSMSELSLNLNNIWMT